jgi:hypothetical protein
MHNALDVTRKEEAQSIDNLFFDYFRNLFIIFRARFLRVTSINSSHELRDRKHINTPTPCEGSFRAVLWFSAFTQLHRQ